MTILDLHVLLPRMAASCWRSSEHRDLIERQVERRAMRMTVTDRVRKRLTPRAERRLQENIDRLRFERRGELDALPR